MEFNKALINPNILNKLVSNQANQDESAQNVNNDDSVLNQRAFVNSPNAEPKTPKKEEKDGGQQLGAAIMSFVQQRGKKLKNTDNEEDNFDLI